MKKEILEYKRKIEEERDIDIFISKTRMWYKIRIEKIIWWKLFDVWTIESSNYRNWNFSTDSHLAHWVKNDFKWEWYGQLLFDLYKMLVFNTNDAIIPEKEYVSKPSRLLFLLKNWYKLESKVVQDEYYTKIRLLDESEKANIIKMSENIMSKKSNTDFIEPLFNETYELILVDEEILSYY